MRTPVVNEAATLTKLEFILGSSPPGRLLLSRVVSFLPGSSLSLCSGVCRAWLSNFEEEGWMKKCVVDMRLLPKERTRFWLEYCSKYHLLMDKISERLGWGKGGDRRVERERRKREVFDYFCRHPLPLYKLQEIQRDVERTLPDHPLFSNGEGHHQLLLVLRAVIAAEPEVGYCQGMNFVGAVLLLHASSPTDAFWLFLCLLHHFHLRFLFAPGVPLLPLRLHQFEGVVRKRLPRLWQHLNSNTLGVDVLAHQWVMTLYAYYLNPVFLGNVWDLFFYGGWKNLFKTGLFLLKNMEENLLQLDLEGMALYLQNSKRKGGGEGGSGGWREAMKNIAYGSKVTNRELEKSAREFQTSRLIQAVEHIPKKILEGKSFPSSLSDTQSLGVPAFSLKSRAKHSGKIGDKNSKNWVWFLCIDLNALVTCNRPLEGFIETLPPSSPCRDQQPLENSPRSVRTRGLSIVLEEATRSRHGGGSLRLPPSSAPSLPWSSPRGSEGGGEGGGEEEVSVRLHYSPSFFSNLEPIPEVDTSKNSRKTHDFLWPLTAVGNLFGYFSPFTPESEEEEGRGEGGHSLNSTRASGEGEEEAVRKGFAPRIPLPPHSPPLSPSSPSRNRKVAARLPSHHDSAFSSQRSFPHSLESERKSGREGGEEGSGEKGELWSPSPSMGGTKEFRNHAPPTPSGLSASAPTSRPPPSPPNPSPLSSSAPPLPRPRRQGESSESLSSLTPRLRSLHLKKSPDLLLSAVKARDGLTPLKGAYLDQSMTFREPEHAWEIPDTSVAVESQSLFLSMGSLRRMLKKVEGLEKQVSKDVRRLSEKVERTEKALREAKAQVEEARGKLMKVETHFIELRRKKKSLSSHLQQLVQSSSPSPGRMDSSLLRLPSTPSSLLGSAADLFRRTVTPSSIGQGLSRAPSIASEGDFVSPEGEEAKELSPGGRKRLLQEKLQELCAVEREYAAARDDVSRLRAVLRPLEAEFAESEEVKLLYVSQLKNFIELMDAEKQEIIWISLAGAAEEICREGVEGRREG